MGRLLATITTLLILAIGAALVAPAFINWNDYRETIDQALSAMAGHPVRTRGQIDIRILPDPAVHIEALEGEASGDAPTVILASASSVDVNLSLQALLAGQLEANSVKLSGPIFRLQQGGKSEGVAAKARRSPFLVDTTIRSLQIEKGQLQAAGGWTLEKIDGVITAPVDASPYRFTGQVEAGGKKFEAKLAATLSKSRNLRISGTITDTKTKASLQADGIAGFDSVPSYNGSFALALPAADVRQGMAEIQAKGIARGNLDGLSLTELSLVLDPQGRPQTLTGSAELGISANYIDFNLASQTLDLDALIGLGRAVPLDTPALPTEWPAVRAWASKFADVFPAYDLRVSLASPQMQFRGDLLQDVTLSARRNQGRWSFENVTAKLPGETQVKLAGQVSQQLSGAQLSSVLNVSGRNLARLLRWAGVESGGMRKLPAQDFSFAGAAVLSDETLAFEGVKGALADVPFQGAIRFDKEPEPKLTLALSSDSFDLAGVELASFFAGGRSRSAAQVGTSQNLTSSFAQFLQLFPSPFGELASADMDIAAGSIKLADFDLQNVSARVKLDRALLTVSKLNLETKDGAAISGQGLIPLEGASKGQFTGKIEAQSPAALRQLALIAGNPIPGLEDMALDDFAPASLKISYEAQPVDAGGAKFSIMGGAGKTQLDARLQLAGTDGLDWRRGRIAASVDVNAADSAKLATVFFRKASFAGGVPSGPGLISLRASGAASRLDTALSIKSPLLQAEISGVAALQDQAISFTGKETANVAAADKILPAGLFGLLGGEDNGPLKISSDLEVRSWNIETSNLRAESAKNVVAGHLNADLGGPVTRLEGDLRALQYAASPLFSALLTAAPAGVAAMPMDKSLTGDEFWTDRPFALSVFENVAAKLNLSANTLALYDKLRLEDVQATIKLENKKLEVQRLEGKLNGASIAVTGSLTAQTAGVSAFCKISAANFDLASITGQDRQPIMTGKAGAVLVVMGQGLSPRGLVSVLNGRGNIGLSDGAIAKLSPAALQKAADEAFALPQPPADAALAKKLTDGLVSEDFRFRRMRVAVLVRQGLLEILRASFRGRQDTVRLQSYVDLGKMQIDNTWQVGVIGDRRRRWPPIKLTSAGRLQDLGNLASKAEVDDLVRTISLKKMEGDLSQLEKLNKVEQTLPDWTTTQEELRQKRRRRGAARETGLATEGGVNALSPFTPDLNASRPR